MPDWAELAKGLGPTGIEPRVESRNEGYDRGHGFFNADTWYIKGTDGPLARVDSSLKEGEAEHWPSVWAGVKKENRAALYKDFIHNADRRPLLHKLLKAEQQERNKGQNSVGT